MGQRRMVGRQQPLKEVTKEEVVFIRPVAFQKLG